MNVYAVAILDDGKTLYGECVARNATLAAVRPIGEALPKRVPVWRCVLFHDQATARRYREVIACDE